MATKLPLSKYIKVEQLKAFNGNSAELDNFDSVLRQWYIRANMPLYYGSVVVGDPDSDYKYVSRDDPNGKSNYILDKHLVAAILSRFEKTALKWWEDYESNEDNPYPNCWRKHKEMKRPVRGGVPVRVEEVSFFELLKKQFRSDMNAREAELELERFKWKLFEHNSMNVTVVHGHIERLMKRAGIMGPFQHVRCIHNCLPPKFREKVEMMKTEKKLWKKVSRFYMTMEVDQLDKKEFCSRCGRRGHTVDVCRKRTASTTAATTAATSADKILRGFYPPGYIEGNYHGDTGV